mmetsp:Transcript_10368/g.35221  ORF Transcript_10368/g.35221 Transcript_10368/m.35221 type:complete len:301 (-) Transcript_10368:1218-2120(-)
MPPPDLLASSPPSPPLLSPRRRKLTPRGSEVLVPWLFISRSAVGGMPPMGVRGRSSPSSRCTESASSSSERSLSARSSVSRMHEVCCTRGGSVWATWVSTPGAETTELFSAVPAAISTRGGARAGGGAGIRTSGPPKSGRMKFWSKVFQRRWRCLVALAPGWRECARSSALGTVASRPSMRPRARTMTAVEQPPTKVVKSATVMVSVTITSLPRSLASANAIAPRRPAHHMSTIWRPVTGCCLRRKLASQQSTTTMTRRESMTRPISKAQKVTMARPQWRLSTGSPARLLPETRNTLMPR